MVCQATSMPGRRRPGFPPGATARRSLDGARGVGSRRARRRHRLRRCGPRSTPIWSCSIAISWRPTDRPFRPAPGWSARGPGGERLRDQSDAQAGRQDRNRPRCDGRAHLAANDPAPASRVAHRHGTCSASDAYCTALRSSVRASARSAAALETFAGFPLSAYSLAATRSAAAHFRASSAFPA